MRTDDCLALLETVIGTASIAAAEGTPLSQGAETVLVMARAYRSDGEVFLSKGDPVNALASAWYGTGWIHFGIASGLVSTLAPAGCPFSSPCESLPSRFSGKLVEKSSRYQRLLDTARASVEPAGDPATGLYRFSGRVLFIAGLYASQGSRYLADGMHEDALACFSYGHGWLDAGVSSGFFVITGNRDLFTV